MLSPQLNPGSSSFDGLVKVMATHRGKWPTVLVFLMTDPQSPRRVTRQVIEMGPQVNEVVNCLTDFINDEKFQAKIVLKTAADDLGKWTEQ